MADVVSAISSTSDTLSPQEEVRVVVDDVPALEDDCEAGNETGNGMEYVDAHGEERRVSFSVVSKLGAVQTNTAPPGLSVRLRGRDFFISEKLGCACSLLVWLVVLTIILCVALVPRDRPTRTYYIAIDEVEWDYVPSPVNNCTGLPFSYPDTKYTEARERSKIGSVYQKAMFREYTDASFQTLAPRAPEWEHLGLLGPALHAEVGDVVEVVVRNNARFPFSFATQAVGTNKANEGASYRHLPRRRSFVGFDDALPPLSLGVRDCGTVSTFLAWTLPTSSSEAGRVAPGAPHTDGNSVNRQDFCRNHEVKSAESRTYTFLVDDASGPGPSDGSSVMHLYTSHVGGHAMTMRDGGYDGFASDSNAGLMGPLIVTRKGHANAAGRPADVDRELVMLMGVQDENDSPYLRTNIWDRIVAPILNEARPAGHVPFGPTSKTAALQALYYAATNGRDKLSYVDAEALIDAANAAHTYVGEVRGIDLHVWFNEPHFNPRWYDASNGGYGSALGVLEQQWKEMVDVNDPAFMESNAMHTVNGYLYCTQPGLTMNAGERVRWYTASVGGTDAIHTPHWHGNTVLLHGGRGDQFELLASSTATVDMVPENPGIWQLHCHVNDHKKAGMLSLYTVAATAASPAPSATCEGLGGTSRVYYVAAEEVEWEYYDPADAAAGIDRCAGSGTLDAQAPEQTKFLRRALDANGVDRIGTTFTKARYVQYTDATFTTRVEQPAWAGLLGATLRGAVGDTIRVVARNNLPFPVSFHPHGVQYQKGAEGAPYNDGTSGADVLDDSLSPGSTHEYVWCVPESAGPGPSDGSSVVWLYHDHVHEINGTSAGLVGPIIISAAESADASGAPTDVDHEFVLLFAALNENGALHTEANLGARLPSFAGNNASLPLATRQRLTYEMRKYDSFFADSMRKRAINGKLQCALQGLEWAVGERVRLHLLSVGDEELHAPTLSGQAFEYQGARHAAVGLMASSMKTVDLTASAAGTLLLSTGSDSGAERGMNALVHVSGAAPAARGAARTYYIAADEVDWDFLPYGANMCGEDGHGDGQYREHADTVHATGARPGGYQGLAGEGFNGWADNGLESEFSLYTDRDAHPHRLGTRYVLALYREYTDGSFNTLRHGPKSRANTVSAHLGMQGPVLRALPGETIAVRLYNRLRFPCNLVVQGLRAVDGLAAERPLLPGETRTIAYVVDRENAPLGDQPSIAFAYRSDYRAAVAGAAAHAAATGTPATPMHDFADANAGLFGALIVTRSKGQARVEDLAPDDVNREFVLFMGVLDQNKSPYLGLNIAQFAAAPETVDRSHPDFKASNRMHAVNGRMYCNLDGLEVVIDRTARWYIFALGTDDAFASPRWYGHAPLVGGSRVGAVLVQPGTGVAADLEHDNYGEWLVEDQTSDHAHAGAVAIFTVHRKILGLCELTNWAKC